MIEVTPELLERHDRPGPRYTSYPTAVEFSDSLSTDDYAACLRVAAGRADDPLASWGSLLLVLESTCLAGPRIS